MYDVLSGSATLADVIVSQPDRAPVGRSGRPDLAGATFELPRVAGSEASLREALEPVRERYAFTLSRLPSLARAADGQRIVAADRVIVPVQAEYFALEGLAGLLDTLSLIQRELEPAADGRRECSSTMHDGRTRLAQDVEREVREHFPELVFDTVIPRTSDRRGAELRKPVIHHDPHCAGADAYFELAKEVAARG